MLYLLVAVLVVIDLVILITWIIVDPIQVKVDRLAPQVRCQLISSVFTEILCASLIAALGLVTCSSVKLFIQLYLIA